MAIRVCMAIVSRSAIRIGLLSLYFRWQMWNRVCFEKYERKMGRTAYTDTKHMQLLGEEAQRNGGWKSEAGRWGFFFRKIEQFKM